MTDSSNHQPPRRPSRRPQRNGLVLVLVLIVIMMLALAGFTFAELMLTENKATHLHGDQLRLQQAVRSGVEQLKLFFEQPRAVQAATGGADDNPALFRAIPLVPETASSRTAAGALRFSVVAQGNDVTGQQPLEGVRYGVQNESGRLHLADLLRFDKETPNGGRMALMQLPGMTEAVADAILDWIDSDSEARPMGAESDYYAGLPQPYSVRNGLPECLEELLLVKGVTRELLFGADRNYNRRLEPEELVQPAGGMRSIATGTTVPWSWLLTIYSGQRIVNSAGQPRINLNDSNLSRLRGQLTAALDPNLAAFIIAYRQRGPYSGEGTPAGGTPPVDRSGPSSYIFQSALDLVGAKVSIAAEKSTEKPKVYASPLSSDPQALATQLPKLLDATTVDNLPVVRGRVSVNHAPAFVLQAVPGIDPALAQRIVAARQQGTVGENQDRRFATWLWSEGLVDLPTMKKLMPYLTGGGDVVRAQVIAHFDKPGPTARAETVLDATTVPTRLLLWRDLRYYGPGCPLQALTPERSLMATN